MWAPSWRDLADGSWGAGERVYGRLGMHSLFGGLADMLSLGRGLSCN